MSAALLDELRNTLGSGVAAEAERSVDPAGVARLLLRLNDAANEDGVPLDELLEVDSVIRRHLLLLAAHSPALTRTLFREPAAIRTLGADAAVDRRPEDLRAALRGDVAAVGLPTEATAEATAEATPTATAPVPTGASAILPGLQQVLRRFRTREYRRLALLDLGGMAVERVASQLSDLADACLEVAVETLRHALDDESGPAVDPDGNPVPFCILGMGKHGGRELNFSSDIDLVYVYGTDEGEPMAQHRYFTRLAELVTRALDEVTEDGFVFRVDLRLRPEGEAGTLVNAIDSAERYYETWGRGRPWERAAWLKARPVAGDLDLGEELLRRLQQFVYRRATDVGMLKEIQTLHERAWAAARQRLPARLQRAATAAGAGPALADDDAAGILGLDLKHAPGCIRGVELFAQSLQLLFGGKLPGIRERSSLGALDRLLYAGLVAGREHAELSDAYRLLRQLEHRVQMAEDRQTHLLPDRLPALESMAAGLGFADASALAVSLAGHRATVEQAVRSLIPETPGAPVAPASADALVLGADGGLEDREVVRRLAALGFVDAEGAADRLAAMRRTPFSPFSPTALAPPELLAAPLLDGIAATPDPDLAIGNLAAFVAGPGRRQAYAELLREDASTRQLMLTLFGTSDLLSKQFIRHPEIAFMLEGTGARAPSAERTAAALGRRLRTARKSKDIEAALVEMRRFRAEELLRIGLQEIGGAVSHVERGALLARIAEVNVETCLELAREEGRVPDAPGLCIVALGRLGSGELGYGSDLDLMFLHDGADADAAERATRLAQRFLFFLNVPLAGGPLYEIDTRLRPRGSQGPLVTSLDGFREYHEVQAQVWERLALVRARPISGPELLQQAAARAITRASYRPMSQGEREAAAQEICRLRLRMQRELTPENPARGRYNVKTGIGGIVDVELSVQWLQLVHGGADESLRVPSVAEAVRRLQGAGILADEDARGLSEAYGFLRRLGARIRVVHDRAEDTLVVSKQLRPLARGLGYGGGGKKPAEEALLEDFVQTRGRVRALFERLVGPVGEAAQPGR